MKKLNKQALTQVQGGFINVAAASSAVGTAMPVVGLGVAALLAAFAAGYYIRQYRKLHRLESM